MRSSRALAAGLAVAVLLGASACGGDDAATAAAEQRVIMPLEASPVPPALNGLKVTEEDVAESLEGAKRPYLEAATLYSLREGEALQATLQVGRFAPDAKYKDSDFRLALANRVGNGSASSFRMGKDKVWLSSGDRQSIAIWFSNDYVFILSTREEYLGSRALLREALGIKP